jgi:hypothetical protein
VCDRICAFLGVEPRRGAFDNLVNERTRAVPGVDRASIRDMLRSNYEYLHDIYGADLPKSWRLDLAELGHAA